MLRHGQTRRDGQVINRKLKVGIGKNLGKGGDKYTTMCLEKPCDRFKTL